MITYNELIERLKKIKEKGYIKTHRAGNTGIGKTLEDLLGIKENNVPGPNAAMIELKSARKGARSMLTLFTKSPLPRGANSKILSRFGYESLEHSNRKELHTTVNAKEFNTIRGKLGFKIDVREDRINLITEEGEIIGYWDKKILASYFERKIPKLLYVKAEARGNGINEEFWFNEAWLLSSFDFDNFIGLVKEGTILVDIRIGQYPNGRPHDHGTGFRVLPDKLDLCFKHRERII
ncbi:MAG: MvaI/BcnI family restriction endonuclease [Candidatus Methanomethyliaceae archaeon]